MSRRRTENRKRLRKDREAEKRRAWERIYDVPSARNEGADPQTDDRSTDAEAATDEASR